MMKRSIALVMTTILFALGLWLLVMGIMNGRFSHDEYRPIVVISLAGGFLGLLGSGLVSCRYAEYDYRAIFSMMIMLLSVGLALLSSFFEFFGLMVGVHTYSILLKVMLMPYGLALIMTGAGNYFLSQGIHIIRPLPYFYFRYRI